ncbi:hypothetical protein RT43_GL001066 [Enterococcus italicus DSM 15952]|nr:hypothetical protein RT43_GL001066 [Enterococcus italicus DSM 15952]
MSIYQCVRAHALVGKLAQTLIFLCFFTEILYENNVILSDM